MSFVPFSNDILPWCLSGATVLLALNTVLRLCTESHRLATDSIQEEDRTLSWKVVLFILLPFLTWVDMRTTEVVASYYGAWLDKPVYGLIWYQGQLGGLEGITSLSSLLIVIFAGALAQIALAVCFVPALALRPSPFVALLLGSSIAFIAGLNLVFEPAMALVGFGSCMSAARVNLISALATHEGIWWPAALQIALAVIFLLTVKSAFVRQWFAGLTRPVLAAELKELQKLQAVSKDDINLLFRLGVAYIKAGLYSRADSVQKTLSRHPQKRAEALLLHGLSRFHRRRYADSRKAFEALAELVSDYQFKGQIYAAAACNAYAMGDLASALNLCDRALEFESDSLVARMVKVDTYLAQGKKDQAAQEIMQAMRLGLDYDLKDRIPLDLELAQARLADNAGVEDKIRQTI